MELINVFFYTLVIFAITILVIGLTFNGVSFVYFFIILASLLFSYIIIYISRNRKGDLK